MNLGALFESKCYEYVCLSLYSSLVLGKCPFLQFFFNSYLMRRRELQLKRKLLAWVVNLEGTLSYSAKCTKVVSAVISRFRILINFCEDSDHDLKRQSWGEVYGTWSSFILLSFSSGKSTGSDSMQSCTFAMKI